MILSLLNKTREGIFTTLLLMLAGLASAQQEPGKEKFIDPVNMDVAVKPGDDFKNYAGGIWLKNNPVPAKETNWGSFTILRDFNVKAVRVILNEAAADKKAASGSIKKRVGDFYAAAMDSVSIDKAGFAPVKVDYARAGSVQTVAQVLDEMVHERTQGLANPLFGFFVGQDRKHPQIFCRTRCMHSGF